MVEDLKTSNISQWYSKIKRMSQTDPTKDQEVIVEEIEHLPIPAQAESIADNFAKIANMYEPLKKNEVDIPNNEDPRPVPLYEPYDIWKKSMK